MQKKQSSKPSNNNSFEDVQNRFLSVINRFAEILPTVPTSSQSQCQMVADASRIKTLAPIMISSDKGDNLDNKDAEVLLKALAFAGTAVELLAVVSLDSGDVEGLNEEKVAQKLNELGKEELLQLLGTITKGPMQASQTELLSLVALGGSFAAGIKEVLMAIIKFVLLLVLFFLKYIEVVEWQNIARFIVWAIRVDKWDEQDGGSTQDGGIHVQSTPPIGTIVGPLKHCRKETVVIGRGEVVKLHHVGGENPVAMLEVEVFDSDGRRIGRDDLQRAGDETSSYAGPATMKVHAFNPGEARGSAGFQVMHG